MRNIRKTRGWTLIEVLIAVILGSLLFGTIMGVMVQMRLEEEVGARRMDALEATQAFLEQLTDDLQHLRPGSGSPDSWIQLSGEGRTQDLRFARWSEESVSAADPATMVRYVLHPASSADELRDSRVERLVVHPDGRVERNVLVEGVLREISLVVHAVPGRLSLELRSMIESPAVENRTGRLPLHVRIVPRELNRTLRSHWIAAP